MFVSGIPFGYQRRGDENGVQASMFALFGDFVCLPEGASGGQTVNWNYYKKPTATLSAASTMDITDMWDSFIIYRLVAHGHGCMYDEERKVVWNNDAEIIKRKARSHFARMDSSLGNAFIPAF